jgi:hypothetical protein
MTSSLALDHFDVARIWMRSCRRTHDDCRVRGGATEILARYAGKFDPAQNALDMPIVTVVREGGLRRHRNGDSYWKEETDGDD